MTAQLLQNPLPFFTGLDGLPLSGGYVYIGVANQDPRQYPVTVYYDEASTLAAVQPLRTTVGYLYRNGTPTNVWISSEFSLMVLDSLGRQVAYLAECESVADRAGAVAAAAAAASALDAAASAVTAQNAADSLMTAANIFDNTTLGLAGTANQGRFWIESPVEDESYIGYKDNAGVAEEKKRLPSANAVRDQDRRNTAKQRYLEKRATQYATRPKLAIVVTLGQSLGITQATPILQAKPFGVADVAMPVGGSCVVDFDFFPTNALFSMHWNELASMVELNETVKQSHQTGLASTLVGGKYKKVWVCSAAIGARTLEVLMTAGPCNNMWGILQRMCTMARAAGYDPEVLFYVAHGEANAAAATTETAYYDLGMEYYSRAQLYAAHAMRRPGYVAPMFFTTMAPGTVAATTYAEVRRAIHRIARDLPGGVLLGGIYQFPKENDRTHDNNVGYILRGGFVGRVMRDYVEKGVKWAVPTIIDCILSGSTATVVYDRPMVKDILGGYAGWANVGSSLSTAVAEDGFEWFDNGSQIAVNAVSISGPKVTLTLATAPVGSLAQQVVRYGEQTITGALAAGAANLPGGPLRSQDAGWQSMYDPTFTQYLWAPPQTFSTVRA